MAQKISQRSENREVQKNMSDTKALKKKVVQMAIEAAKATILTR